MKTLLIVYHSRTGGTAQMAQACAQGARGSAGVQVRCLEATAAASADLLAADGYVFACPENLATMTGEMKTFFDLTYYDALDCLNGRPCAMLICAGSDGEGALRQMQRIATGWRLKTVAEPIIVCTHAQTPEAIWAEKTIATADLERCRELGAAMAAGLEMGVF
ncbi:MAG: NAD(P)H-dependent oxidoreductase [Caulobacteraceae bacterium]|nr:NAD(P)H-dependent oxidoreductase [Caulobacteraceae bacterium]